MLGAYELMLCDIQGRIFEGSIKYDISSENFIKRAMKSEMMKHFDMSYSHVQWAGEEYDLDLLKEELDLRLGDSGINHKYTADTLFWIGYVYRYAHFYKGKSSRQILKQIPPSRMAARYAGQHVMDPELVIDEWEEQKI